MSEYNTIIHRVVDDSYVITKNGFPYHVYPYAAEFAQEWDEVFAYAEAHPECVTEEQPYVSPVLTLEIMKTTKLSEINAAVDKAIATLTADYPDWEISTFGKQEAEARAYTADPTTSTPLLSALAQARGISFDELVHKVLANANAFTTALGSIIGQRQALKDQLNACTTVKEIQDIVVNIVTPI